MHKLNRRLLTKEIAEYLRNEILISAEYRPGAFIREEELAHKLETSRPTIREAFKIMEGWGIVESVPHKGVRILNFSTEERKEIYKMRDLLEIPIVCHIMHRGLFDENDFQYLGGLLEDIRMALFSRKNMEDKLLFFSQQDLLFHRYIHEKGGGKWARNILSNLYFQIHQMRLAADLHVYEIGDLQHMLTDHLVLLENMKARRFENIIGGPFLETLEYLSPAGPAEASNGDRSGRTE